MSEPFILDYLPLRMKQLGYSKYYVRPRDLLIKSLEEVVIPAYNELFFIVDEPLGLIVESDYGVYDSTENAVPENIHIHRGEIIITNPGDVNRRIKFIQAIIVN
jgi:hypothetical protein